MSSLEGLKELLKDLVLSFLSRKNFRVLVGFVYTSDIVDINPAVTIGIELLESLGNNLSSSHVHWASDGSNEFVISDLTAGVNVEVVEDGTAFSLGETKLVVVEGFEEFHLVQAL